jgi:hypothetical protein
MDLYTLTANQEHATKATKAAGVNKIYVQHPNHGGIVMSMAQMKEAVRLGALIEIVLSGEGLKGGGPQVVNAENPVMDYGPQKIADIRALGPANVVISTDLGQPGRVNYAQARELKTQKRGETAQVFRTLHSVNVEAIRKNDIVRSTEIVSQIHQLLASVWGFPLDEPPPYFPRQVIDLGGCSGERFVLAHPVRSGPQRPVRANLPNQRAVSALASSYPPRRLPRAPPGTRLGPAMVGTSVSHYHVIGTIGTGGMGVVYLALDERLNRKVALKFLPPAIAQDPQARARLTREAQAMSAVDHPNFASVYDIGDWNGQLFIAMPYYEGETLRQRIDRAPLTVSEAIRIAEQIASGLEAAHRADIVHRDVKPGNIMLASGGQVKILDFGLAMSVAETNATMTRMTQPGLAVGTIAYMSPEQTTGQIVDARSDVWALGVTLYEMLTGRLPFQGCDVDRPGPGDHLASSDAGSKSSSGSPGVPCQTRRSRARAGREPPNDHGWGHQDQPGTMAVRRVGPGHRRHAAAESGTTLVGDRGRACDRGGCTGGDLAGSSEPAGALGTRTGAAANRSARRARRLCKCVSHRQ